ncbi:carboxypeptidase-like regulatory domain-containing protein [Rufibacter sediminis]|uniref:Carboxypeptidase-like regulatory domain-containing protein n=1 Tax=Rufibacter sediminis TaxID=2762756 RepID=A0ABR6VRG1_9BACT|nr:TonB-dependent receptor [Rufibacter sediminis]MBC3539740.1 carboxypeptidase-like regulatory domain-containing protein [Rufibacter sediminis]
MRTGLWGGVLLLLLSFSARAQQAYLQGVVQDAGQKPLVGATITLQDKGISAASDPRGRFNLKVEPNTRYILVVSYIGYQTQREEVQLLPNETRFVTVELQEENSQLTEVRIRGKSSDDTREQVSITRLDPRLTQTLPSPFQEFNKILLTLPGVTSNNELSSSYSVRGGSFDENLVYVNGIEVYRPFLNISGQQEGLSFVNPDLVEDVTFSSGGWQPKYGDKLSSVLDIQYRTPTKFAATVSGSLTGGSVHTEGTGAKGRFGYLLGARYKSAAYVLNSLEVEGDYRPKFSDIQTYLTYDLSPKEHRAAGLEPRTQLSFLGNIARNNYQVRPETRETTFGNQFQMMRLLVGYDGQEQMRYTTYQGGLRLQHAFTPYVNTELIYSGLYSQEREFRDLESGYRFCDVLPTPGVSPFNRCAGERGVGTRYEYSRNRLRAALQTLEFRTTWTPSSRHQFSAGIKGSQEDIRDVLNEYSFQDSSDYVYDLSSLQSQQNLSSKRYQGFAQHQWNLDSLKTLTYGVRFHYWSVNKQLSVSPRVQYAVQLPRLPDWSFKLATGLYVQAPIYRELRTTQGNLVTDLNNQQSWHFITGSEYRFKKWGRPFKLTAEGYYKYLPSVIPYDQDNMRIRYLPQVNATAYAAGIDVRVNGEFIKGEESWFSLGFLRTRENLTGDSTITRDLETGQVLKKEARSYIRRPTDQLLNFGVYFQDHLPNNPTLRMYLNMVFSTGLPFSPPGNLSLRSGFPGPSYKRVDIGFSKLITIRGTENADKLSLKSLWLSLEVLNLIAANNVISYNYVRDLNSVTYAVPNYLTGRLINLRFIARL